MQFVHFQRTSFAYESASQPLLTDLNLSFPAGWSGIIGLNGAGKTTLLRLACGGLQPTDGAVQLPGPALYCPQRTDDPPQGFEDFLNAYDGTAAAWRGRLAVRDAWLDRWDTCSHGERKRAQLAVALWQDPSVLAVDEPTNHLDAEARDLLSNALKRYRGVGLLVSHDRALLDELCGQCAFVEPPAVVVRPGGYTQGREQADAEAAAERERFSALKAEHDKLQREAARRRQEAARADGKRSKRGLAKKDHDAKGKLDQARVTGKDGQAGRLARQMDARVERARAEREAMQLRKRTQLGIGLPGARARRDALFRLGGVRLPLGADRFLDVPELVMRPSDRIALTGPNGAGKSTLVHHLVTNLELPPERVAYLPQEIPLETSRQLLADLKTLPKAELGQLLDVVHRLGTPPERVLDTDTPSPGELRKLLLAAQAIREPYLILMDEPTNHLDLPAVECLEAALAPCPAGLLLVSHDRRFLDALTERRWRMVEGKNGAEVRLELAG